MVISGANVQRGGEISGRGVSGREKAAEADDGEFQARTVVGPFAWTPINCDIVPYSRKPRYCALIIICQCVNSNHLDLRETVDIVARRHARPTTSAPITTAVYNNKQINSSFDRSSN